MFPALAQLIFIKMEIFSKSAEGKPEDYDGIIIIGKGQVGRAYTSLLNLLYIRVRLKRHSQKKLRKVCTVCTLYTVPCVHLI